MYSCGSAAKRSREGESDDDDMLASSQDASPSYGTAYLYDADLLARRIGPDFARELKSVQRLLTYMRCWPCPSVILVHGC